MTGNQLDMAAASSIMVKPVQRLENGGYRGALYFAAREAGP